MTPKPQSPTWTRAGLAREVGAGPETLRFYEEKGLMETPVRNASGYRIYGAKDVERLQFIQRAQDLGFSLQDIRQLLQLTGDIRTPRNKVREFAKARLTVIRQKINDLRAMEKALSGLVARCDGKGAVKGCPIAEFVGGQKKTSKEECCHE